MAMGMIPKDAIADDPGGKLLGLECAGRVVAVGDAVSEFAVGDEVVADRRAQPGDPHHGRCAVRRAQAAAPELGAGCDNSGCLRYRLLLAPHARTGMRAGERVLIHSAAGGVGLAAVQLALKAGAIVFATAGSPEKRELLSALGVPHVMDSRSLAFADEVLELTEGEGVDLVLNSLAGEAIDKNLSILRPLGRFIEIGLIDIYKNRKIGMRPLRENISLFAVDLSRAFEQRPELAAVAAAARCWRGSRAMISVRSRTACFRSRGSSDAFRYMAQAKHVGKLVVSMQGRAGAAGRAGCARPLDRLPMRAI